MTYLSLNLFFVIPSLLILILCSKILNWKALALASIWLFLATAVFDNFIVGTGIVDYDDNLISGIKIGFAPIEDFAYTLVGLCLIPVAWALLGRIKRK